MEIQNIVLRNRMDKWLFINPIFNKFFENYKVLIELADRNLDYYQLTERELIEFIDGVIYFELSFSFKEKDKEKERKYSEKGYELLKPVLDAIIKHVNSESYREYIVKQQITGKNTFEFGGVNGVIDIDAIKLHANRIGKHILMRKDVEEIEKDFVKYNREIYSLPIDDSKLRFTTKLDQSRMKAIHQYFYEEKFIEPDEASWLYWFDLQPWLIKKKNPGRIKWIKASYHLTNVVYILCGNMAVNTEKVMKKAFILRNGRHFQKKTIFDKSKEPYKKLYEKMEMAHHSIK